VDEKSDEAIVLRNNGRQPLGGSREGRASPKENNHLGGRGSDTEPKCRVDPNDGCASADERD
jgi:hypothetical protein